MAAIPAIIMVMLPRNRSGAEGRFIDWWRRIRRNTPAVTRVEECTSAETGVGAAIAIGSQVQNGNCALFVAAAMIRRVSAGRGRVEVRSCQWLLVDVATIARIKATSPMRLVIAVIKEAPAEYGLW